VNYSLQRVEHGEQAPWLAVDAGGDARPDRAAGRRVRQGYGSLGYIGRAPLRVGPPTLPQGRNPVGAFIPFARVADMLLHPGEPFYFDAAVIDVSRHSPRVLVRRNPFHHHQTPRAPAAPRAAGDDRSLHEAFWTPMARPRTSCCRRR